VHCERVHWWMQAQAQKTEQLRDLSTQMQTQRRP